jgi:hypothetical protein
MTGRRVLVVVAAVGTVLAAVSGHQLVAYALRLARTHQLIGW